MLWRAGSTFGHHLNKLGWPHIPNATYQHPRSSAFWFWRRFLKVFLKKNIWAWQPSWSCDQDHFEQTLVPHPKESPYVIRVQFAQWFQRRRNVDGQRTDGRRKDAGVIGILLTHPWAFGIGELKVYIYIYIYIYKGSAYTFDCWDLQILFVQVGCF